MTSITVYEP